VKNPANRNPGCAPAGSVVVAARPSFRDLISNEEGLVCSVPSELRESVHPRRASPSVLPLSLFNVRVVSRAHAHVMHDRPMSRSQRGRIAFVACR